MRPRFKRVWEEQVCLFRVTVIGHRLQVQNYASTQTVTSSSMGENSTKVKIPFYLPKKAAFSCIFHVHFVSLSNCMRLFRRALSLVSRKYAWIQLLIDIWISHIIRCWKNLQKGVRPSVGILLGPYRNFDGRKTLLQRCFKSLFNIMKWLVKL